MREMRQARHESAAAEGHAMTAQRLREIKSIFDHPEEHAVKEYENARVALDDALHEIADALEAAETLAIRIGCLDLDEQGMSACDETTRCIACGFTSALARLDAKLGKNT
jgi:hypothetical protein